MLRPADLIKYFDRFMFLKLLFKSHYVIQKLVLYFRR